ncbi:MAG TPA: radical SAM protein, partial [Candidatus Nitrosotalea sp.]|nr:radical SAM protein [Candidatus Nitrosotalea sp.]
LSGCDRGNKRDCQFCDSLFNFHLGRVMSFQDIFDVIDTYPRTSLLVITGGEPFIQDNITDFIRCFQKKYPNRVQIESNGDRLPKGYTEAFPGLHYPMLIVSPKPVNGKYLKLKDNVKQKTFALKFLIEDDPNSPYYDAPSVILKNWPTGRAIYISPITVYNRDVMLGEVASFWNETLINKEATMKNYIRAAKLALEHNYIVSTQKHLLLSVL